jgi:hypothetical protein
VLCTPKVDLKCYDYPFDKPTPEERPQEADLGPGTRLYCTPTFKVPRLLLLTKKIEGAHSRSGVKVIKLF